MSRDWVRNVFEFRAEDFAELAQNCFASVGCREERPCATRSSYTECGNSPKIVLWERGVPRKDNRSFLRTQAARPRKTPLIPPGLLENEDKLGVGAQDG